MTSLRNVIGGLTLDRTLTSREDINAKMRVALDEVTEGWGVRVTRVELKDIIPPHDVQQAMEKQMQAEREKRAAVFRAEGRSRRQCCPPKAKTGGDPQSGRAAAVADPQSRGRCSSADHGAEGASKGDQVVFSALTIAIQRRRFSNISTPGAAENGEGAANKLFVVPSELQDIAALGATFAAGSQAATQNGNATPAPRALARPPVEGAKK